MKMPWLAILLAIHLLTGCAVYVPSSGPTATWVPGQYVFNGYQWVWYPGHYEYPPYSDAVWVDSYWAPGHVWTGGHWGHHHRY